MFPRVCVSGCLSLHQFAQGLGTNLSAVVSTMQTKVQQVVALMQASFGSEAVRANYELQIGCV